MKANSFQPELLDVFILILLTKIEKKEDCCRRIGKVYPDTTTSGMGRVVS